MCWKFVTSPFQWSRSVSRWDPSPHQRDPLGDPFELTKVNEAAQQNSTSRARTNCAPTSAFVPLFSPLMWGSLVWVHALPRNALWETTPVTSPSVHLGDRTGPPSASPSRRPRLPQYQASFGELLDYVLRRIAPKIRCSGKFRRLGTIHGDIVGNPLGQKNAYPKSSKHSDRNAINCQPVYAWNGHSIAEIYIRWSAF